MAAYSSVTWTTGDIITETKLDNMVSNDRSENAHESGLELLNNTAVQGKDSGGTLRELLKINASDELILGNSTNLNKMLAVQTNAAQYRTLLNKAAAQSITSGSFQVVNFGSGSEVIDTGSMHSTSVNTSRITIPSDGAGAYLVYASIIWAASAAGNRRIVSILVDGSSANPTIRQDQGPVGSGITVVNAAGFVNVTGGQYLEVNVYQDSGSPINVDVSSSFSAIKIA